MHVVLTMRLGPWPQKHSPDHTPHEQDSKTSPQLLKSGRAQAKPWVRGEVYGP